MKTSRIAFLMLGLSMAAALSACTKGLQQDPYADQDARVRDASPVDNAPKEKKGDALSPEYLRIQSDDSVTFAEGSETKTTIRGAVLSDVNGHTPVVGQDYELSIDNMTDFPGASFDAVSGEFKWTPATGYVSENYTRNVHIDVTLATKFAPYLKTQRSIIGVITRGDVEPTIVSVDDLTATPTKENTTRDFKVVVRDPHGLTTSANTKPRLSIVSDDSGTASAANFIRCAGYKGCKDPEQDPNDPLQFIFKLTLDLRQKEVTKGQTTLSFGLMATSRFGESSGVKTYRASIITDIGNPEMSWSAVDPINVTAGQNNTVSFTVYDPNSDGDLTVNFDTRCDQVLGANAVCTCSSMSSRTTSTQLCTISWNVPVTPSASDFQFSISTFNQSKYDPQIKKYTFPPRTLHVVQPGSGPIHTAPAAVTSPAAVAAPAALISKGAK